LSHFEYVSIAVALIYALVIGRLLTGLGPSIEERRRYPIQIAWILTLFLVCIFSWWQLWATREVEWTALRFLWILALPSLLYIRAAILTGSDPREIDSFRDHFFSNRLSFFGMGVATAAYIVLSPWIYGGVPWLSFTPLHTSAIGLGTLSIAGLIFRQQSAHWVIVLLALSGVALSFVLLGPIAVSQ
jgi:hypothetical protein